MPLGATTFGQWGGEISRVERRSPQCEAEELGSNGNPLGAQRGCSAADSWCVCTPRKEAKYYVYGITRVLQLDPFFLLQKPQDERRLGTHMAVLKTNSI